MIFAGLLPPFAVVLAVSGAAKLRRPDTVAPALTALGLRPSRSWARLLGGGEAGLGVLVLAAGGGWLAGGATAWFAGLTLVSAVLVHRGTAVPCGCFGVRSAPPSHAHTAANAAGATICGTAAAADVPSLVAVVVDAPLGGTLLALQAALGSWLLLAVYRDLPRSEPEATGGPDFALIGRR